MSVCAWVCSSSSSAPGFSSDGWNTAYVKVPFVSCQLIACSKCGTGVAVPNYLYTSVLQWALSLLGCPSVCFRNKLRMASLRTLHLCSLSPCRWQQHVGSESREACLMGLIDIRVCSEKCPETDLKLLVLENGSLVFCVSWFLVVSCSVLGVYNSGWECLVYEMISMAVILCWLLCNICLVTYYSIDLVEEVSCPTYMHEHITDVQTEV